MHKASYSLEANTLGCFSISGMLSISNIVAKKLKVHLLIFISSIIISILLFQNFTWGKNTTSVITLAQLLMCWMIGHWITWPSIVRGFKEKAELFISSSQVCFSICSPRRGRGQGSRFGSLRESTRFLLALGRCLGKLFTFPADCSRLHNEHTECLFPTDKPSARYITSIPGDADAGTEQAQVYPRDPSPQGSQAFWLSHFSVVQFELDPTSTVLEGKPTEPCYDRLDM